MSVALFVYGTLGPDEPAWHLLEPYVLERRPAAARGRLYDTGRGYPGATFDDGDHVVHGWCCMLDDPPLDELDAFEGDEYERVRIRLEDGTDALGYAWVAPLDDCVAVSDGTWTRRDRL